MNTKTKKPMTAARRKELTGIATKQLEKFFVRSGMTLKRAKSSAKRIVAKMDRNTK